MQDFPHFSGGGRPWPPQASGLKPQASSLRPQAQNRGNRPSFNIPLLLRFPPASTPTSFSHPPRLPALRPAGGHTTLPNPAQA